jgi:hypothetical protein
MNLEELKVKLQESKRQGSEEVMLLIPGRWSERGYKKLLGVKGEQIQEFEDGVACAFPIKELREAIKEHEKH